MASSQGRCFARAGSEDGWFGRNDGFGTEGWFGRVVSWKMVGSEEMASSQGRRIGIQDQIHNYTEARVIPRAVSGFWVSLPTLHDLHFSLGLLNRGLSSEALTESNSSSCSQGPVTRSKSRAITSLVSEPLVMSTPPEEILKKLEAFMLQQTEITKELKGAVETIQAKQNIMEENLASQIRNKSQGDEESVDEEIEMEKQHSRFEGPEEGGPRKRQRERCFGGGKGPDSWRTGEPQPFRHDWEPIKEPLSHRQGWEEYDEGGSRGGRPPRFTKMEFPSYDGKGDPLEWLQKYEDFFDEQQTQPEAWVRQATFSLQGKASGWYRNLRRMKERLTWGVFSEECKIRFGPPKSMNPLGELTKARQTGTVEDYCETFESLLGRTTGVTHDQSIWHFCAGLWNAIRYEVEFARPQTLYYAMNLARQIELKVTEDGRIRNFNGSHHTTNRSTAVIKTRDTGGTAGFQNREKCNPAWKRLTTTEMADRRAKGLCFNCDELFSIGHKCAKLFCILMADEEDESQEDEQLGETPKISLNAIRGEKTDQTFQVQGFEFSADFFAIPLEGFDVVLGIRWLQRLGRILWDFTVREMEFKVDGKTITWHGESPDVATLATLTKHDDQVPNLDSLLEDFADLFETPKGLPPSRPCDHRIRLLKDTEPVAVRPYRYPHLLKDEIEKQCSDMMQTGIIRPSQSPFSSPVLLVKKSDGSWRFCVDYRELTSKTIKDKFPIPVVDELLDELHGATIFMKLDLAFAYHQVRMFPTDVEKTAFRTHHDHFEFLVMPFGLSNAPSTFQSLMNSVFGEHLRSHSLEDHLAHLHTIFTLLRKNRLFLKKSKCAFGNTEIAYLGHIIKQTGVTVDQSKIESIRDWPKPHNVRSLRGFLGLSGYYRKFIKDYGIIAAPLTSMLRRGSFTWTTDSETAFENPKNALSGSPVLALPDFSALFVVECDASGSGVGAVLQQDSHPVAFFSRKLADRHHKLPAYERELIGLAKAVAHWCPYLWGRHFLIKTDHYSLKYLLEQRLSTSPQQHWVSKLLGFDFSVEYRAGVLNRVADALSRREEEVSQAELFTISEL
ncbi:hypothetical protein LXL04_020076 [Taraxacum kok-saghyz]